MSGCSENRNKSSGSERREREREGGGDFLTRLINIASQWNI